MKSTNNFPLIEETITLMGQEATYRHRKTTDNLINQLTVQLLYHLWEADDLTIFRTKGALGAQIMLREGLPTQDIFKVLHTVVCILHPGPDSGRTLETIPKYKD